MIFQLILLVSIIAAFVATLRRGRAGAITRTETVAWGALWIAAGVVVVQPDLASRFAETVGVGRGADLVMYASVVALFYLMFRVFLRLEKIDHDITSLVRRDALDDRRDAASSGSGDSNHAARQ